MDRTEHERYLAEEVAVDYADGLIDRREALRRLGLMGFQAVAATTLLAACARGNGDSQDGSAASGTSSAPAAPSAPPLDPSGGTLPSEEITFEGPTGTIFAAYAAPTDPIGAVQVIHENRGLKQHFRDVVGRLARDGYAALAIDLLSEEGGTATLGDDAAAMAALGAASAERFVADMRAGLDELERRHPGLKLAQMGFCFGGGQTWSLLGAGEPRLAAAAPFYGTPPDSPDLSGSQAAVLAIYGAEDSRVNATRETAIAALVDAGLEHKVLTFEGAGHAFFNDTGGRYHPEAAAEAYDELLTWFGRHLA